MVTYNEGPRPTQFILNEANGQRSRDNITIAASQDIKAGSVLSGSGGTYSAWSGGAGTLAIALYPALTEASGDPVRISALTRDCEVNRHAMAWPDGFTDNDIEDAAAELAKQGIIVRGVPYDQMGGLPSPASP